MKHTRTLQIEILANGPKLIFPPLITVNSEFELFGNLPFIAVYSEIFKLTNIQLISKKLTPISDVDGMYIKPEQFCFETTKGYVELRIKLMPIGTPSASFEIDFDLTKTIHETVLMGAKDAKRNNAFYGQFGICVLSVLNPVRANKYLQIVETDEHILQAEIMVDLETMKVNISDTTIPTRHRMFEVEMANLYFHDERIQNLIRAKVSYVCEPWKNEAFALSTYLAKPSNSSASVGDLIKDSFYDNDL